MQTFIGYSTDNTIRHKASSGGVGTALVKYLFDVGLIKYALSFEYDSEHISYKPSFITSFDEYKICGSIYQEMNTISYLKNFFSQQNNLNDDHDKDSIERKEKGKIALFALPCQTRALRMLCEKAGYECIIIGLTCSSQQSHEATSYLLSRIGVKESEIVSLQYRGNGWPSGIQIKTKNKEDYFVSNNNSIWTDIFHSRLFIQKRCFGCRNTLNDFADIVLADPWLRDYETTEKEGQTLFATYTKVGEEIVDGAMNNHYIEAKSVNGDLLYKSQISTIVRKEAYNKHPLVRDRIRKVFLSAIYKKIMKKKILFKYHCKIKNWIENKLIKKISQS